MRRLTAASLALACACALGASGAAQAAHWRVGVYMGGPAYPYYYGPVVPAPYYYAPYPPPVIIAPDAPETTYIERSQEADDQQDGQAGTQPPQGSWWYCDKTRTYYPYVKHCASGWREVPATPPAPRR